MVGQKDEFAGLISCPSINGRHQVARTYIRCSSEYLDGRSPDLDAEIHIQRLTMNGRGGGCSGRTVDAPAPVDNNIFGEWTCRASAGTGLLRQ